ncbi:Glycosyl transferase family 2 [Acetitomaculum ruminis DSM 5522]|uniref:Glycosyl transferase family 2 n=1 Tax=Acetitomaculum ruminis DSM 5522 TaxID=1120918 RepID=A0A1I0V0E6_9FIRM|nr:glycosyltransferase [Acetitomaculum ruminis]SFA69613.1 Glycosyl transferase family 2 [Acetitomaculum ruminis DSM 5522]
MDTLKKFVIIPACMANENLVNLVNKISKGKSINIIVVDDGNRPETKVYFDKIKNKASVIYHMEKRGKKAAVKTALNYIKNIYPLNCLIIILDLNIDYSLDDIIKVFECLEENTDAVVLGLRNKHDNISFKNGLAKSVVKSLIRFLKRKKVFAVQSDIKGFSNKNLQFMLDTIGEKQDYDWEIFLKSSRDNKKIIEVEIESQNQNKTRYNLKALINSIKACF